MENNSANVPSETQQPVTGGEGTARPEGAEAPAAASLPNQPADSAGSEGVRPAEPAKIKFTSKIRRGLALMRMVNIAALSDDQPPPQRFIEKMTGKQQEEYNAAMAWIEQEEDWDAVASVWQKGGGR